MQNFAQEKNDVTHPQYVLPTHSTTTFHQSQRNSKDNSDAVGHSSGHDTHMVWIGTRAFSACYSFESTTSAATHRHSRPPDEVLIGEDFDFEVKFKNNSGNPVGYAPYIELYFPAWGTDGNSGTLKCDGIEFISAETLFASPPTVVLPWAYKSGMSAPGPVS